MSRWSVRVVGAASWCGGGIGELPERAGQTDIVEEALSGTGRLRRPVLVEAISVPRLCELPQCQQRHRLCGWGHFGATAVDTNGTTGGDDVVPPFSCWPRNEYDSAQRGWGGRVRRRTRACDHSRRSRW